MTVALFVLDVAEFKPLVEQARALAGAQVVQGPPGYWCIRSEGELSFNRKALSFKPAVWYGALTGGLVGQVAEFSRDTLRLSADA